MELFTFDKLRNIALSIYIEQNEKFLSNKHSMFRLVLVEEGTGILKLNDNAIIFMAPTIFCLNEEDYIFIEQSNNLVVRSIYFSPDVINDVLLIKNIRNENIQLSQTEYQDYCLLIPFIERSGSNLGQLYVGPSTARRVAQLFDKLSQELESLNNNFWRCRSRSFFLEILFLIQYIYTEPENLNKFELLQASNNIINDIILYLHTNYENKITINKITETFHLNRTTLSEQFENVTGIPIIEYLIKLRIRMACIMLKDTQLPINEIMYRTGFKDSTHFGRMFRKHTGYSPSQYRIQKSV